MPSAETSTQFETRPPFYLEDGTYSVMAQLAADPHSLGPSGVFAGEWSAYLEHFDSVSRSWSLVSDKAKFFGSGQEQVELKAGQYRVAVSNATVKMFDVTKI